MLDLTAEEEYSRLGTKNTNESRQHSKVLSVWNNLKWFLKKHLHLVIFYKFCFKRFYIEWFHVTYLWFVLLSRKPLNRMCSNRRVNRLLSGFEETIIIMHPPNHCSTFKNKQMILLQIHLRNNLKVKDDE